MSASDRPFDRTGVTGVRAGRAARMVLEEVMSRREFKRTWETLDSPVRREIFEAILGHIEKEIRES